jgi:hypothetical protein
MENTELALPEGLIEIDPPQPNRAAIAKTQPTLERRKPFLCRHIFADGRRCGSPALRAQNFCYYHYAHRTPTLAHTRNRSSRNGGFDLRRLDGLDNPTSIQLALSEVLGQIATNEIDTKRAGLLLYGLQIAGNNIRRSRPEQDPIAEAIVEEANLGALAEAETGRPLPLGEQERMIYLLTHPDAEIPEDLEDQFPERAAAQKAARLGNQKVQGEELLRQYFADPGMGGRGVSPISPNDAAQT